ncbi:MULTISPECIES: hypothetical protein [Acinetobacter]|jgi:hypothetical protein|uniref:hypothetical protein n=1 Tax=Acinetobacter TaxID=469 RepID=UPI000277C1CD|nr:MULTISPECIES: hypothetical protein [Acinetobacter]EJO36026.1 hypothetical protein ACINWCA157_2287 [Acinetobacter radioresistens WC-A-157]EXF55643.1 hypothetical protein J502_3260 [Acinetobacter sp. 1294596]MCX0339674.1 hypothetical protein [Acinetobacter radioresistens]
MGFMKSVVAVAIIMVSGQVLAAGEAMNTQPITTEGKVSDNQLQNKTRSAAKSELSVESTKQEAQAPLSKTEQEKQRAAAQEQLEKMKEKTIAESSPRKGFFQWFKKSAV